MVEGAAGGGETLFWIGGKTVSEVTLEWNLSVEKELAIKSGRVNGQSHKDEVMHSMGVYPLKSCTL